jgi:hypothetical protein
VSAMYIMGRGWMVPLTTIARCVMLCMPRMALCRQGREGEGGRKMLLVCSVWQPLNAVMRKHHCEWQKTWV